MPEGENLLENPEGGLLSWATSHRSDLQARCDSFPVENRFGETVGTNLTNVHHEEKGHKKTERD
jgi:hypothetical protein